MQNNNTERSHEGMTSAQKLALGNNYEKNKMSTTERNWKKGIRYRPPMPVDKLVFTRKLSYHASITSQVHLNRFLSL